MQRKATSRDVAGNTVARVSVEFVARTVHDDEARFMSLSALHREVLYKPLKQQRHGHGVGTTATSHLPSDA